MAARFVADAHHYAIAVNTSIFADQLVLIEADTCVVRTGRLIHCQFLHELNTGLLHVIILQTRARKEHRLFGNHRTDSEHFFRPA